MGLETGSHIDDLVTTNPASGDARSQGDDHIRLIKTVLTTDFPAITGPVTATQAELNTLDGITTNVTELNLLDGLTATAAELNTLDGITTNVTELNLLDGLTANATELNRMDGITATTTELNYTDGVTSAIQTQINTKAPLASPALTGNPTAPTQTAGNDSTRIATTAFVQAAALSATLPSQSGNAGKYLQTDGSTATWEAIDFTRDAKTTSYTIDADDKNKLIDFTTGSTSATLSFSAASSLGNGWSCYIRNSGAGSVVTLDPNSTETIDGLTTFNMYPNEVRLVLCDGSVLRSIVIQAFYRVYEASTTWTKPPGYAAFGGFVWGGGAGGGGTTSGGGGGGCFEFKIRADDLASGTHTITIGAGGAYQADGGDSSFANITVTGGTSAGVGGAIEVVSTVENANSVSSIGGFSGGQYSSSTNRRQHSVYGGGAGNNNTSTDVAGNSVYGGGGGGRGSNGSSTEAGHSIYGGNGGNNGENGSIPGGGGGATSGAGARGEIHIFGIV